MAITKVSRGLLNTGISDSSDATAITIDSSERVGIGLTSPASPLHVRVTSDANFEVENASGSVRLAALNDARSVNVNMEFTSTHFGFLTGNLGLGTTTINTGTLGTSNKFLEVAAGTANGSGTIILSRTTNGNNNEIGGLRFVNTDNADDDGLDSDGKLVAAVSARSVTTDSNASDDSGANLLFYTKPEAGNYAERMRIASSGRVGIGDTSPDAMLKVVSNSATVVGSWIRGTNYGLRESGGSTSSHYALRIANSSDASLMTVNGDGKVMIGGTSPSSLFQVNGTVRFSHAYGTGTAMVINNTNANNNYIPIGFHDNGTSAGYIFVNGSLDQTSYVTSSDYRLKENVNYSWNALEKVKELKPAEFNMIKDEENTVLSGFLAHEVGSILPQAITGEKDAVNENGDPVYQGIDHSKLVPLLTKAIQEQQTVIEDLKTRIEVLEA